MGPWEGPGEKLTAETLSRELPDDWHIFAGRKIPNRYREDVDLIIVGPNFVFVSEQKHWGPQIVVGDTTWTVLKPGFPASVRGNALDSATAKSRKVAGWLRETIKEWPSEREPKLVMGSVVLSYPNLDIKVNELRPGAKNSMLLDIRKLEHFAGYLTNLDKSNEGKFPVELRKKAIAAFSGMAFKQRTEFQVEGYEIYEELPKQDVVRIYRAERLLTGEECLIRSYPAGSFLNAGQNLLREKEVLNKINRLDRTWRVADVIQMPEAEVDLIVLIKPPSSLSLSDLAQESDLDFASDTAVSIATQCFKALSEIHELGIAHKAISPGRIWLSENNRARFSDFFTAHVDGLESVIGLENDSDSQDYRSPETQESIALGSKQSDVFSLALSLMISFNVGATFLEVKGNLEAQKEDLASLFLECLNPDKNKRLTSLEAFEFLESKLFAKLDKSTPVAAESEFVEFAPGSQIGKWEIIRHLGNGSMGAAWLVQDKTDPLTLRTLKALRSHELYDRAKKERNNAEQLFHERCARFYDLSDQPGFGFILSQYIEGDDLLSFATSHGATLEVMKKIAFSSLEVLDHIHARGLVHGDLSPRNIIISENQDAYLIDFGLLSKIGDVIGAGTPAVMAPEIRANGAASAASDLFSFAASLFLAFLSRQPFVYETDNHGEKNYKLQALTEAEERQWGEEGSLFLKALLRCCVLDHAQRPQSVTELEEILLRAKPIPVEKLPNLDDVQKQNSTVASVRGLYRRSKDGASEALGLGSQFAKDTYLPTKLDENLMPTIFKGQTSLIIFTGNAGDGKTSFLQVIQRELVARGGSYLHSDDAGWVIEFDGRQYHSVFDASESSGNLSSDDLLRQALNNATDGGVSFIAANDGRLRNFFIKHENEYPDWADDIDRYFDGKRRKNGSLEIIDLKNRSLEDFNLGGLASGILAKLTEPKLWEECSDCSSRGLCPIYQNVELLRGPAAKTASELVLTSHLMRKKRATMRDVRSALAWLITADLTCDDVHAAVDSEQNQVNLNDFMLYNNAFTVSGSDDMLAEWHSLDPAFMQSAALEKEIYAEGTGAIEKIRRSRYIELARKTFFRIQTYETVSPESFRHYRYFDEIKSIFEGKHPEYNSRILLGLSKLLGAPGFASNGLAIGQTDTKTGWTVIKLIEPEHFTFTFRPEASVFMETVHDRVALSHDGKEIELSLDSLEIILRAADGYLIQDRQSSSIRYEISAFADRISRASSRIIQLVSSAGSKMTIAEQDGVIKKVGH
jgi:serine/threonine protein kinase